MSIRVGQRLGNYQLVRLLGQGGFAQVYLGEHIYLKTQAAIKVLHTQLGNDEQAGFLDEARTIAHLRHPSIVRVLEFGVEASMPFLVMTYAPNGTLRQCHPKGTRLPLPTIISYVNQVAAALQYAHHQKLIHRDVKPENMLLGRNDEVLLSDFGIAVTARHSASQSVQQVGGTVTYMAPEQLRGKPRPASDQYALGIVVYEWLCGTRPFSGNYLQVAAAHLSNPVPPLHDTLPDLSPQIEAVVLKALSKDPHDRFGGVQAFAAALEEASLPAPLPSNVLTLSAATSTPPLAVPLEIPTDMRRRLSRRTVLIGLGGLAVVAGGAGGLVRFQQRPSPAPVPSPPASPIGTTFTIYHGHSAMVSSVAWSPDGKRIASASYDRQVQVWDAATGKTQLTYRGHTDKVNAVAWSPDGRHITSASDDQTVQVWDATSGSRSLTYRAHTAKVTAVAWSPDSKLIASASPDRTVQVWDALSGKLVSVYTYPVIGGPAAPTVGTVAWSPNGQRIASSLYLSVDVWDVAGGNTVFSYQGHAYTNGNAPLHWIYDIAWSLDGTHIASASADQTVQVWDATSGSPLFTYRNHTAPVNAVAWFPNDARIASASDDQTVQVWDALTGKHVFTYRGHAGAVKALACSSHELRMVSGGEDKTARTWQAA